MKKPVNINPQVLVKSFKNRKPILVRVILLQLYVLSKPITNFGSLV
jgi:hypothetical protein